MGILITIKKQHTTIQYRAVYREWTNNILKMVYSVVRVHAWCAQFRFLCPKITANRDQSKHFGFITLPSTAVFFFDISNEFSSSKLHEYKRTHNASRANFFSIFEGVMESRWKKKQCNGCKTYCEHGVTWSHLRLNSYNRLWLFLLCPYRSWM